MDILIIIGIFAAILFLIEGGYSFWRTRRSPEKKGVRRRLGMLSVSGKEEAEGGLERQILASGVPWLNRILLRLRWTPQFSLLLEQAGIQRPVGFFLLLTLVAAGVGFMGGLWVTSKIWFPLFLALFLGGGPYGYVRWKRKRRMAKFERQLPEALSLMARSLKAGHAFVGSLKMVADEMDDPIGVEFEKTLGEVNFGIDLPEALKNLSNRVECPDLRFFVISIIIQRETGGNLAEILENIASLIRERFKLQGRIRVLAAEGKFSAVVLVGLPFLIFGALTFLSPQYIGVLMTDPLGHIMVAMTVSLMIVGILVIKGMVAIKV